MKLYDSKIAPNARRVRMFLAEKGIKIPQEEIDIMAGENLQHGFKAKNPRGVVPTLELDDGSFLDESVAISRYFEEICPTPRLMGTDAKSIALIESRQRHIEFDGLAPLADIVRNTIPTFEHRAIAGVTGVAAIKQLIPRGIQSFERFLDRLNTDLGENKFVAGEHFSIADITAFCTIDSAKSANIEIPENHSNTLRWFANISARPSAQA